MPNITVYGVVAEELVRVRSDYDREQWMHENDASEAAADRHEREYIERLPTSRGDCGFCMTLREYGLRRLAEDVISIEDRDIAQTPAGRRSCKMAWFQLGLVEPFDPNAVVSGGRNEPYVTVLGTKWSAISLHNVVGSDESGESLSLTKHVGAFRLRNRHLFHTT